MLKILFITLNTIAAGAYLLYPEIFTQSSFVFFYFLAHFIILSSLTLTISRHKDQMPPENKAKVDKAQNYLMEKRYTF